MSQISNDPRQVSDKSQEQGPTTEERLKRLNFQFQAVQELRERFLSEQQVQRAQQDAANV